MYAHLRQPGNIVWVGPLPRKDCKESEEIGVANYRPCDACGDRHRRIEVAR